MNKTNTTNFTVALDLIMLNYVFNAIRAQPKNAAGYRYDDGPRKDKARLCNAYRYMRWLGYTKKEADEGVNELAAAWLRNKGAFEDIRLDPVCYEAKFNPLMHWCMLCLTFLSFFTVAKAVSCKEGWFSAADIKAEGIAGTEIEAVLSTMVALGGLECSEGVYRKSEINIDGYGASESYDQYLPIKARCYLENVVQRACDAGLHADGVKPESIEEHIAPAFYPFRKLLGSNWYEKHRIKAVTLHSKEAAYVYKTA